MNEVSNSDKINDSNNYRKFLKENLNYDNHRIIL